jgi:hypothetical protein
MDYEVIDNFLPKKELESIQNVLLTPGFTWHYNPFISSNNSEEKGFQLVHGFYVENMGIVSNFYNVLTPLLEKINPSILIRIKANLGPKTHEHQRGGWHTDTGAQCKTAVFYVNTTNGYTEFEDGSKVEGKENRFLVFDSQLLHTGVSQTDEKVRCVINFDYIVF